MSGLRRRAAAARAIALLLPALLFASTTARAGTEEFSTLDVEAAEADDESLLDHMLTRVPHEWRDAWEHAPQALRTAQGCLTSGQWFIDTDLKVRAPMGRHARFGLDLRQFETDIASYEYFDFSFKFPTRAGTPGFMFRPTFDKSRQDFGLTWETGADTTAQQLQFAFIIEDMFNNLWAFRQTRVGNEAEPYERHPYEPGLRYVTRHDAWRAEVGGRWLTPSRKRVSALAPGSPQRLVTLWGASTWASVEARALGVTWEARGANLQARGTDQPEDLSAPDARDFRRMWSAEFAASGTPTPRLAFEARCVYQDRDQNVGAPVGPGDFGAIDRLVSLEGTWAITRDLHARVGGMYDRISIAHSGVVRYDSYGTRNESRAFIGLMARFGKVRMQAVEGIELDPEPYDVWLVHDKGFLQLQAEF